MMKTVKVVISTLTLVLLGSLASVAYSDTKKGSGSTTAWVFPNPCGAGECPQPFKPTDEPNVKLALKSVVFDQKQVKIEISQFPGK